MTAKKTDVRLITSPEGIKQLTLDSLITRLRHRPMKPGFESLMDLKEFLCLQRLRLSSLSMKPNFTSEDLQKVLKGLKKKKARDPHNYLNELFRPEVIGNNLKESLLVLFNKMRKHKQFSENMLLTNVSSIYKGKGS